MINYGKQSIDDKDIIIIDAGMEFAAEDELGADYIVPDETRPSRGSAIQQHPAGPSQHRRYPHRHL